MKKQPEELCHRITALEVKTAVLNEEHLKDVAASQMALELNAKEIERRLDFLNGEAGRLKEMQSTYLPREVYESKHELLEQRLDGVMRLVYIGVGAVAMLEIVLKYINLK